MNPERQLGIFKKICELSEGIVWENNCNPFGLYDPLGQAIQGLAGGPEYTLGLYEQIYDTENFRGSGKWNSSIMYCRVTDDWITLSVIIAQLYNRDNCKHRVQIDSEITENSQQNNAET